MNIIIVGCGRVGSQLAVLLAQEANNVAAIDTKQESFANLGRNFDGRTVVGVGFDEEVLRAAGIEECDVLAAVTDSDNSNIMIGEVARRLYDVPHVLTRVYDPGRESAYLQLGLDCVCGTTLVAEEMFAKIMVEHSGHVDTFGNFEVLRFGLNLDESDVESIKVSELEREREVRIVAFERQDGSVCDLAMPDTKLYQGDIVLACVHKDRIPRFSTYIQA